MAKKEITNAPAAPRAKQATGRVSASKNLPVVTTVASKSSKSNTKTVAKKAVPAAPAAPRAKRATGRVAASKNRSLEITRASIISPKAPRSSGGFFGPVEAIYRTATTLVEMGDHLLNGTPGGKMVKGVGDKAVKAGGKALRQAANTGQKISDNLSGAEVQARIVALVEQQRRYNDILATRLAEALDRIEKLEKQIARPTHGR